MKTQTKPKPVQAAKAKKPLPKLKLTKKQIGTIAVDQLYCLAGCILCAASVNIFSLPNKIAQSGVSGIAVIIHTLFPKIPVGMANLAMNIPLAILVLIFIGWRFLSKTLVVVLEFSLILDLMPRFITYTYTDDPLLATVFAGALSGAGAALYLSRGATGGGTEAIGWLIRKRWPHMSIGRVMMSISVAVVISGALAFGHTGSGMQTTINSALRAAIMIFISTRIIDSFLYGMNNGKMFYIFSGKAEDIAQAVISEIGRGASILPAKGAYTGEQQDMLMCVVHRNEVTPLRRIVKEHDPNSFMVVAEAQEVFGFGFKGQE